MPAHDIEVDEAEQEGVQMMWLSTIGEAGTAAPALARIPQIRGTGPVGAVRTVAAGE